MTAAQHGIRIGDTASTQGVSADFASLVVGRGAHGDVRGLGAGEGDQRLEIVLQVRDTKSIEIHVPLIALVA